MDHRSRCPCTTTTGPHAPLRPMPCTSAAGACAPPRPMPCTSAASVCAPPWSVSVHHCGRCPCTTAAGALYLCSRCCLKQDLHFNHIHNAETEMQKQKPWAEKPFQKLDLAETRERMVICLAHFIALGCQPTTWGPRCFKWIEAAREALNYDSPFPFPPHPLSRIFTMTLN